MANDGRSNPTITNCTFARNHALDMYGALYSGTGPTNVPEHPGGHQLHLLGQHRIRGAQEDRQLARLPHRGHLLLRRGWYEGEGNISADPLFVDSERGDFRLGAGFALRRLGSRRLRASDGPGRQSPVRRQGQPDRAHGLRPLLPQGSPSPGTVYGGAVPSLRSTWGPSSGRQTRRGGDRDARRPERGHAGARALAGSCTSMPPTGGSRDGKSWATAPMPTFRTRSPTPIRVQLRYGLPQGRTGRRKTATVRASFRLKQGLALYGGFPRRSRTSGTNGTGRATRRCCQATWVALWDGAATRTMW